MKKRILLFCILSIILTLTFASCGDSSDAGKVVYGDGLKFIGNGDGTCRVAGFENVEISNLVIPSKSPDGDTVTSIGYRAFAGCSDILNVSIPEGVTSIAKQAFSGCSGISFVEFPDSIVSIGDSAFSNCYVLNSVSIGKNLKIIGSAAFSDCYELSKVNIADIESWFGISFGSYDANPLYYAHDLYMNSAVVTDVKVPNSVTSITKYAFYGCSCIENITIGSSVKNIGNSAFNGCSGLKNVVVGNNVKSIEQSAFAGCSRIQKIEFPDSVTNIANSAFSNCSGLAEVTFGRGMQIFGTSAFSGCSEIKNIDFPDGVTSIGDSAFSGCSGLESVNFGKSVQTIGQSAFYECSNLADVTFAEGCKLKTINDMAFAYCSNLSGIDIPKNVSRIGDKVFRDCIGLSSITVEDGNKVYTAEGNCLIKIATKSLVMGCQASVIPSDGGISSIGSFAFQGCSGLTSVAIPKSVKSIDDSAFSGCTGLEGVYIEDLAAWCGISFRNSSANPLYYAHDLYLNNELIEVVSIPEGVKKISKYAFYGCTGLSGVNVTDLAAWCKISFGDYYANPLYYAHDLYIDGERVENLVIPDGVESILPYSFSYCTGITSAKLPDSVTNIGSCAFYGCTELKSIEIPESVTGIGLTAFYDCSGLLSIRISKNVKNISYGAFFNCTHLESIIVDKENATYHSAGNCLIKTLTKSVVLGCKNSVIPIDGSVTIIGPFAFAGCEGLTSISIPDTIKSIAEGAFSNCENLEKVYIKDIAAWCAISFSNASANPLYHAHNLYLNGKLMTELVVPDNVPSVGSYAFYGCQEIKSINIGKGVRNIGSSVFVKCGKIESIKVSEDNTTYRSENNCLIKMSTKYVVLGCKNSVIPTDGSIVGIGSSAFHSCAGLKNLTIPDSIKTINDGAFSDCTGLKRVDVSSISTWLGISFANSSSNPLKYAHDLYLNGKLLVDLTVPNGVNNVSKYAFYGCSLNSVSISDGVKSIGNSAFGNCENLVSIVVDDDNTVYHSGGDCLIKTSTKTLVLGCQNSVIPGDGSVTSIGSNAFLGCSGLVNIVIPGKIRSIGDDAFSDCSSLLNINIPSSVKSIDSDAFVGCLSIESITVDAGNTVYHADSNCLIKTASKSLVLGCKNSIIPTDGSVTILDSYSFTGCIEINTIDIPKKVKNIGDHVFEHCYRLTAINYDGTMAKWNTITKGENWDNNTGDYIVYCVDGNITK